MTSREVYVATTRVYVASVVAQLCAAGLVIGVLGSIFTWDHSSALFDFADSPHGLAKPELGYLFGSAAILLALPLVRHRDPHVAYVERYRLRLGIAAALWVAGFVVLLVHLGGLGGEYTLKAGAYVAPVLILAGLAATMAMWPTGLSRGLFDRRGRVEPA